MINVKVNDKKIGEWTGFQYCLKQNEFIEFPKVVKGYTYEWTVTNIGGVVRQTYGRS